MSAKPGPSSMPFGPAPEATYALVQLGTRPATGNPSHMRDNLVAGTGRLPDAAPRGCSLTVEEAWARRPQ